MAKLTKLSELSWGQKFALIKAFKLDDATTVAKMNVTPNELHVAKELLRREAFAIDDSFDCSRYAEVFNPSEVPAKKVTGATSHKAASTVGADGEAPKKRGRKGDKITKAFQAITSSPIVADQFTKQHNISLAVLRQSKRFDKSGIPGTIHVKKREGALMVWREVPVAAAVAEVD